MIRIVFQLLQSKPVTIVVGSRVWVEDAELIWIDGEVVKINGEEAEIQISDENTVMHLLLFWFLIICCLLFCLKRFSGVIFVSIFTA